MTDKLKYLVLSDIHFGHRRNPTKYIISHLKEFFKEHESTLVDIDILFIAGDLFDRLLEWPSDDASDITLYMVSLAKWCARNNIKLRILEGTPSHDWKQSKSIATTIFASEIPVDFKYIDTLSIEYIADHDLYVLYVPDEWHPDPKHTFKEVQDLMADKGIDSVDIAIMHGQFTYQLQGVPEHIPRHDESDYLSVVKHWVNIGHIHTHSVYERIVAQGSFDRLAHGEEEPKGATLMYIDSTKGNHFVFLENKHATIFKTISINLEDMSRIMDRLDTVVKKLPDDSHLRLKVPKTSPILSNITTIRKRYPCIHITTVVKDKKDVNTEDILGITFDVKHDTGISITKENIYELLLNRIKPHIVDMLDIYDDEMKNILKQVG